MLVSCVRWGPWSRGYDSNRARFPSEQAPAAQRCRPQRCLLITFDSSRTAAIKASRSRTSHQAIPYGPVQRRQSKLTITLPLPSWCAVGIYFPSLSLYMGAKAAANFGPEWICPPETDIPLRPISSLRPLPEAEHLELTQNVERRRAEFMALQEQRESERLPPSSCDPASVLS
jgi:hypothetical protein